FDALIVGAGIAGCATALELLSAGWHVGLLHQREDVSGIESLSPDAIHNLRKLSIDLGSEFAEVVAWWGSDQKTQAVHSNSRVVQRTMLADRLRLCAIERGAHVAQSEKILGVE